MRSRKHDASGGFTLIEVLIAVFVVGTVIVGVFGMFVLGLRTVQESERRVVGIALANEKMEMIRNLPYVEIGTVGGVPTGVIPQVETVTRNESSYTVKTDIRYIDDSYDGLGSEETGGCIQLSHYPPGNAHNCQDLCAPISAVNAHLAHGDSTSTQCDGTPITGPDVLNTDYKQARVEVKWNSPYQVRSVLLVTDIAPAGMEGGEEGGTLDLQVINVAGEGVSGTSVQLSNDEVSPAISLNSMTNEEGRFLLPGMPVSAQSYKVMVSKEGMTSEQTYDTTSVFTPDTEHEHLSILQGEITNKTMTIDLVSEAKVQMKNEANAAVPSVAYNLRGTKTIGMDDDEEAVYLVNEAIQTDSNGQHTHTDLAWDTYSLTIDGAATGYDIKESSRILPLVLDPGESIQLDLTLVPHTPISLQMSITDTAGQPVDNATVRLTGHGIDQTLGTGILGQVYFGDLPEVGDYALEVTASGFNSFNQTMPVSGTSKQVVVLSASG